MGYVDLCKIENFYKDQCMFYIFGLNVLLSCFKDDVFVGDVMKVFNVVVILVVMIVGKLVVQLLMGGVKL